MTRSRRAWGAALALIFGGISLAGAAPAAAQRPLRDVGSDLKHVGEDVWHVWTTPTRGSGQDWLGLVATGAAFAIMMPVDDEIDRWAVRNDSAGRFRFLKEFRSGGAAYKGATLVPVAAAAYIAGIAFNNRALRDGVMGCITSYVAQSYPRKVIYRAVGRDRPSVAEGDQYRWRVPGRPGGKNDTTRQERSGWYDNSFPGGHFSNLMTCASFLGNRFEMGLVEPVLYGLALAVGVGRLADQGHWASDQMAGGVMGYAVGRTVAIRQLKRERLRQAQQTQPAAPAVAPPPGNGFYLSPGASGVTVGWSRSF